MLTETGISPVRRTLWQLNINTSARQFQIHSTQLHLQSRHQNRQKVPEFLRLKWPQNATLVICFKFNNRPCDICHGGLPLNVPLCLSTCTVPQLQKCHEQVVYDSYARSHGTVSSEELGTQTSVMMATKLCCTRDDWMTMLIMMMMMAVVTDDGTTQVELS